jgi:hypothetical protein
MTVVMVLIVMAIWNFVIPETLLPQLYISVYRIPRRSASTLFIFAAANFTYTRAGATCFKSH